MRNDYDAKLTSCAVDGDKERFNVEREKELHSMGMALMECMALRRPRVEDKTSQGPRRCIFPSLPVVLRQYMCIIHGQVFESVRFDLRLER